MNVNIITDKEIDRVACDVVSQEASVHTLLKYKFPKQRQASRRNTGVDGRCKALGQRWLVNI